MLTQITCPACQNRFSTELYQIVDVGLEPDLKDKFMSGYLNVAECPVCGSVTQVTTPLLYHDPQHELFMVYVPLEMNLSQTEREEQIGQLVKGSIDRLPAEQRRGYMLQPQTMMSMQSLMEKVLESEGVTQEMLATQRSQLDLLQRLLSADKQSVSQIIDEHDGEIDESFFALLEALIESSQGTNDDKDGLKLINLRAQLFKETIVGKRLERQKKAVHAFTVEAKREGLSHKLLLKHVLANREDANIVRSLVIAGQQVFDYQFFLLFSERIEKREKSGVSVQQLVTLRDDLLSFQQEMDKQSREAIGRANKTLDELMGAEDKSKAVKENISRVDDLLMMVLSANLSQAEENGNSNRLANLLEIQEAIFSEVERQSPPEIRLINQLVRAENQEQISQLLDENSSLLDPQLLQLVDRIKTQAEEQQNSELIKKISEVHSLIATRLVT